VAGQTVIRTRKKMVKCTGTGGPLSGRGRVIPLCRSGFHSWRQRAFPGGAGLWQSLFDAHGQDHSCERPPCGCLHLNLATLGQSSWRVQARARVPDIATSDASVSEQSGPGG